MDAAFERKLIACLDALEEGGVLEEILARYPQEANELRPMLTTALQISDLRVAHSLQAQAASHQQMLDGAAVLRSGSDRPQAAVILRRLFLSLTPVALLVAIIAAGLIFSSTNALPGDALYGAKRTIENVRLSLTEDQAARENLLQQLEMQRLDEIRQLLIEGREVEVEFDGFIEAMAGDSWTISGLSVTIGARTAVDGEPAVGRIVMVRGMTADGRVIAGSIIVRGAGTGLPTPSPPKILEPTRADGREELMTAAPTETPVSRPTETPSPTPSPTQSPTNTPLPTATMREPVDVTTPAPRETPEIDDNINDNGDGSDDNVGDNNDNENTNNNANDNDDDNSNDDDETEESNDNDNKNSNDDDSEESNDNDNKNSNDDDSEESNDNVNSNDDDSKNSNDNDK